MTTYTPERTNGHAHHQSGGRVVPELPTITFPGSGRTAQIRKVGTTTKTLIDKTVRKEMAAEGKGEPQPPIKAVPIVYDDPTQGTIDEADDKDPEYVKQYRAWDEEFRTRCALRLYDYVVKHCLVYEVDHIEVARIKQAWQDIGIESEDTDEEIYLNEILMPTEIDTTFMAASATQASIPSEEDVQAMIARFRSRL